MALKRLNKVLASANIGSRRGSEDVIFEGRVKINGKVILTPQTMVDLEKDKIEVDNMPIQREEKKLYFILNKPKGYICSNQRKDGQRIVIDLFYEFPTRLFTIGRLDRGTTGLLLVTNDGYFSNKIIHPSSNIEKEYLVKVAENVTHEHLLAISKGVYIDNKFIKPKNVTKMRKGTIKIIVKEGKKHEVRLFIKKAGLTILELTRIRIGDLRLGSLAEGYYRELTSREKELLLKPSVK
ncbi:MAG: rRNA pseudouridine synthase [Chlamydiae bacterium]|nr:rRNA pseudouridine synthase [Chlamydiota bacterium]